MHHLIPRHLSLSLLVAIAALPFAAPAMKGDTLTLTLTPAVYNVMPGQSFMVSGTLSQSNSDTLTGFTATASVGPCSVVNCPISGFDPAVNAFLLTTSNALTLYSGPLLDVAILPTVTVGSSGTGSFIFSATDQSGPAPFALSSKLTGFTINVVAPVPETASLVLLGGSAIILIAAARRLALGKRDQSLS